MESNIFIMSTKEEWVSFYKSLRDVLRNGDSKFTGMEAFNEINTLLILVFIEGILHNFMNNKDNIEMCSFSNIYDLFYTNVEKKIIDDNIKEPFVKSFRDNIKKELFSYLFEKVRRFTVSFDKTTGSQTYTPKNEVKGDPYLKHKDPVFFQILQNKKLGRLFIRIKTDDTSSLKDVSTITTFHQGHANDVYEIVKKIAETFYLKNSKNEFIRDENGKLQSILRHGDLNYDALGSAYEKFMTDDTMNSKNTGEFFTRRDLIKFTFDGSGLTEDDIIYDSSVGTGGFLLESIDFIKNKLKKDLEEGKISKEQHDLKFNNFLKNNIHGNEIKPNLYKSLILNILMHDPTGLCLDNLKCVDSMLINDDDVGNKEKSLNFCTYATGNPPYGVSLKGTPNNNYIQELDNGYLWCIKEDKGSENYFKQIMTGKNVIANSSGQFIIHFIRSLKDGGHARFIIDRGILINGNDGKKSWHKSLRKYMLEKNNVYKIVLLPTGIFEHTGFATCLIYIQKGVKTTLTEFQELYFKDSDKGIGFKPFFVGNSWNISYNDIKTKDFSLDPKDYQLPLKELDKNKVEKVIEIYDDSLIKVEWKKIGDIIENQVSSKVRTVKEHVGDGIYPLFTSSIKDHLLLNEYDIEEEHVIVNKINGQGKYKIFFSNKFSITSGACIFRSSIINNKYLFYILNIQKINDCYDGNGRKSFKLKKLENLEIPIPSMECQNKIVEKLDTYFSDTSEFKLNLDIIVKNENANKLLNFIFNEKWSDFFECIMNAQQKSDLQYANDIDYFKVLSNKVNVKYNPITKSRTKRSDNDFIIDNFLKKEFDIISEGISFETKKIGELITFFIGKTPSTKESSLYQGDIPWVQISDMKNKFLFDTKKHISIKAEELFNNNFAEEGDLLLSFKLSIGKVSIAKKKMYCNEAIAVFKNNEIININYLYYLLQIMNLSETSSGCMGNGSLNKTKIKELYIKIPSIEDQNKIVEYLDKQIEFYQTFFNKVKLFYPNTEDNNDSEIDESESLDEVEII